MLLLYKQDCCWERHEIHQNSTVKAMDHVLQPGCKTYCKCQHAMENSDEKQEFLQMRTHGFITPGPIHNERRRICRNSFCVCRYVLDKEARTNTTHRYFKRWKAINHFLPCFEIKKNPQVLKPFFCNNTYITAMHCQ